MYGLKGQLDAVIDQGISARRKAQTGFHAMSLFGGHWPLGQKTSPTIEATWIAQAETKASQLSHRPKPAYSPDTKNTNRKHCLTLLRNTCLIFHLTKKASNFTAASGVAVSPTTPDKKGTLTQTSLACGSIIYKSPLGL